MISNEPGFRKPIIHVYNMRLSSKREARSRSLSHSIGRTKSAHLDKLLQRVEITPRPCQLWSTKIQAIPSSSAAKLSVTTTLHSQHHSSGASEWSSSWQTLVGVSTTLEDQTPFRLNRPAKKTLQQIGLVHFWRQGICRGRKLR